MIALALLTASGCAGPRAATPPPLADFVCFRLFPPVGGYPDLIHTSVSTRLRPYGELEIGMGVMWEMASAYARFGMLFPVFDLRDQQGRGWSAEFIPRAGVRGIIRHGGEMLPGGSVIGAADFSYWFHPHLGISIELSAGTNVLVETGPSLALWIEPEARLALGIRL